MVNDLSENWFPPFGDHALALIAGRVARRRSSWASRSVRISPKPPVAMLELLSGAAGAGLVASDFSPSAGIFGVSSHGGTHGRPGVAGEGRDRFRHREFILAGRRIDVVRLHKRQVLLRLGWRLLHDLD